MSKIEIIAITKNKQKFECSLQEPFSLNAFSKALKSLERSIRDDNKISEDVTLNILVDNRQLFTLNNVKTQ